MLNAVEIFNPLPFNHITLLLDTAIRSNFRLFRRVGHVLLVFHITAGRKKQYTSRNQQNQLCSYHAFKIFSNFGKGGISIRWLF